MSTVSARVRAVVTVEFDVGTFAGSCSFEGLRAQVTEEARNIIDRVLVHHGAVVKGKPKIALIMAGED